MGPDKMLQGRLFSYADTHRYRLGANHLMIPVNKPQCVGGSLKGHFSNGATNGVAHGGSGCPVTDHIRAAMGCPYAARPANYQRDGPMSVEGNQGASPNYYPNSFGGPQDNAKYTPHSQPASGDVKKYNSADDDNFSQVAVFWTKVLDESARDRLVDNIAGHLVNAESFLQARAIKNFGAVHSNFGAKLTASLATKGALKKVSKSN